jgi:hypothetical protein
MSKKRVHELQKEMDKLQTTEEDIELQVKLLKSQAYEKRQERYDLMKKDFTKNKDAIIKLDKEEKNFWDSVRSLNDFQNELKEEREAKTMELVLEAVEIRGEMERKLKADQKRVIQDLMKKKFEYLVELEKTVRDNKLKNMKELQDVNDFILEHGNAKMIPSGQYKEFVLSIDTGYGRKYLPSHMVSSDDYTLLFGREDQQNATYRLFKETGEIVTDPTEAQRKLREKGSK